VYALLEWLSNFINFTFYNYNRTGVLGNGDPDIHCSNYFIREDYTRITQQLQQQQQRIYHSPPPTPILDPTLPRPPRKPLPPVPSDEIDVCAS